MSFEPVRIVRDIFFTNLHRVAVNKHEPTTRGESLCKLADSLISIGSLRALNSPRWIWYGKLDADESKIKIEKGSWLNVVLHVAIRTSIVALPVLALLGKLPVEQLLSKLPAFVPYAILGVLATQVALVAVGALLKASTYLISSQVKANFQEFNKRLNPPPAPEITAKPNPAEPLFPIATSVVFEGLSEEETNLIKKVINSDKNAAESAWSELEANMEDDAAYNLFMSNYEDLVRQKEMTLEDIKNFLTHLPSKRFKDPRILDLLENYYFKHVKVESRQQVAREIGPKLVDIYFKAPQEEKASDVEKRLVRFLFILQKREFFVHFSKIFNPNQSQRIKNLELAVQKLSNVSNSPLKKAQARTAAAGFSAEDNAKTVCGVGIEGNPEPQINALWNKLEKDSKQVALIVSYVITNYLSNDLDDEAIKTFLLCCPESAFKLLLANPKVWLKPELVKLIQNEFGNKFIQKKFTGTEIKGIVSVNLKAQAGESPDTAKERMTHFWQIMSERKMSDDETLAQALIASALNSEWDLSLVEAFVAHHPAGFSKMFLAQPKIWLDSKAAKLIYNAFIEHLKQKHFNDVEIKAIISINTNAQQGEETGAAKDRIQAFWQTISESDQALVEALHGKASKEDQELITKLFG
jgi:hypothetical protein